VRCLSGRTRRSPTVIGARHGRDPTGCPSGQHTTQNCSIRSELPYYQNRPYLSGQAVSVGAVVACPLVSGAVNQLAAGPIVLERESVWPNMTAPLPSAAPNFDPQTPAAGWAGRSVWGARVRRIAGAGERATEIVPRNELSTPSGRPGGRGEQSQVQISSLRKSLGRRASPRSRARLSLHAALDFEAVSQPDTTAPRATSRRAPIPTSAPEQPAGRAATLYGRAEICWRWAPYRVAQACDVVGPRIGKTALAQRSPPAARIP